MAAVIETNERVKEVRIEGLVRLNHLRSHAFA